MFRSLDSGQKEQGQRETRNKTEKEEVEVRNSRRFSRLAFYVTCPAGGRPRILSASMIAAAFLGRTKRATSRLLLTKISVGHSFTRKERPIRRLGPSSILILRIDRQAAKATSGNDCG